MFYLILAVAGGAFGWMIVKFGYFLSIIISVLFSIALAKMLIVSGASDRSENNSSLEFMNAKLGPLNDNHE